MLDVVAVESFTRGRLSRNDASTQTELDAAQAAAATYCGWHVTPVLAVNDMVLDGTGDTMLMLPTLKLVTLTSITEDGVALNLADLHWSAKGIIAKRSGLCWTSMLGGITATFSHGFASAADFDAAVLSAIDRGSFSAQTLRAIGPFQYGGDAMSAGEAFTPMERMVLDRYSLERRP